MHVKYQDTCRVELVSSKIDGPKDSSVLVLFQEFNNSLLLVGKYIYIFEQVCFLFASESKLLHEFVRANELLTA